MSHRKLRKANKKSNCTQNSATHSPIALPQSDNCIACSLTCNVKFDYTRVNGWEMSIVRVVDDTFRGTNSNKSILRYYVNNFSSTPFRDITFNNSHYQLEFIEFYLPSIHQVPVDTDTDAPTGQTHDRYPMEMVLCHRALDTVSAATKWLNVSVFAEEQTSYSLTNTFFYQLVNTVLVSSRQSNANGNKKYIYNSRHLSKTSKQYMPNIKWTNPVVNNSQQRVVDRNNRTNGSPAVAVDVGENWTPYHVLPTNKAFYSYYGEFVYAPCTFDKDDRVAWIVMQHPVAIHQGEYNILRAVIEKQSSYYTYNNGLNYTPLPPAQGRNVMYNNGAMVVGNQDQDKFIIKCVKRDTVDKAQRVYATDFDEIHAMKNQLNEGSRTSTMTTYKPPQTTMSAIVFCIVISILLFAIFASANWAQQASGKLHGDKENVQYGVIAFTSIALFILYGLSFVMAAVVVGTQPFGVFLWTALLLLWTAYPMRYLIHMSAEIEDEDTLRHTILAYCIKGFTLLIWINLIGFGAATAFAPLAFLNGHYAPVYSYFMTIGSGETESVYIGRKAVIAMNFAGYQLDYFNKDTSEFDQNYRALPNEFMDLYGHLHIQKPDSGESVEGEVGSVQYEHELSVPLQLLLVQKQIVLKEYDRLMKQDHTRPLDNLVNAVKNSLEKQEEELPSADSTATNASPKKNYNRVTVYNSYNTPIIIYYTLDNIDNFKTSMQNTSTALYEFMAETKT